MKSQKNIFTTMFLINVPILIFLIASAHMNELIVPFKIIVILLIYMFLSSILFIVKLLHSIITQPVGHLKFRIFFFMVNFILIIFSRCTVDFYIKHSTETFFENILGHSIHALIISFLLVFIDKAFNFKILNNRKIN